MGDPFLQYDAVRLKGGQAGAGSDHLIVEAPLSILVNGEPLTVTMQTPGNEVHLTRGLLYTEGIRKVRDTALSIRQLLTDDSGYIRTIDVDVTADEQAVTGRRSLLSVSSCGICGKTDIDFPAGILNGEPVDSGQDLLVNCFSTMQDNQRLFSLTGGCHAAAAFDRKGRLLSVMEDIGRHNAVDKVVGDLLGRMALGEAHLLTVSGRVSYEIVAKCFAAGIPLLAAVSSVSSLAADFAKELGITLIGYCRDDRATVYAHPERIIF
jgi:FdhD protein